MNPEKETAQNDIPGVEAAAPQGPPQSDGLPKQNQPVVQDIVMPKQTPADDEVDAPASVNELKQPPQLTSEEDDTASANTLAESTLPTEEAVDDTPKKEKPPKKQKLPKEPKAPSNKPIGFIIGVIIVSLTLMALVVMMYVNQEEPVEAPAVTPETMLPIDDLDMQPPAQAPIDEDDDTNEVLLEDDTDTGAGNDTENDLNEPESPVAD